MRNSRRTTLVTVVISFWPCLSYAQRSSSASQRVELSFLVGVSRPSVVVEEPATVVRTPPTVRGTGDSFAAITQDVTARFWWTRRMSTIVGGGWSTEERRDYSFPRPTSPPSLPFTRYESQRSVSYHNQLLSVSQAWDLTVSGPVVLFVGGGVEFRSAVRRQDSRYVGYTDPSSIASSSTERSGRQIAALATFGVRILVGGHLSVLADGSLFSGDSESGVVPDGGIFFANKPDTLLGRIAGRWRAGMGIRF
jgi:hypothetical protein